MESLGLDCSSSLCSSRIVIAALSYLFCSIELVLTTFLYYLGALSIIWRFVHWILVSTLLLPDSKLHHGIPLGTCTEVRDLFQTIRLPLNTLCFLLQTVYLSVSLFSVVWILFLFSIFVVTLLCIKAYGLVSQTDHTASQQLSWACHFHFCRVVAVGRRSLHIFTSTTSRSSRLRPRFKHFHAISCTVFLFHLFFFWRYLIYLGSV